MKSRVCLKYFVNGFRYTPHSELTRHKPKDRILQKFRTINLKIQEQISLSTNMNTRVASQKTRKLHMKVFGRVKESKWRLSCKSM